MYEQVVDWFGDFAEYVNKRGEFQREVFWKMCCINLGNDFTDQQQEKSNDDRLENEFEGPSLSET